MANYYATARSNYFAVKDAAAFLAWAKSRQLAVWDQAQVDGTLLYAIGPDEHDDSGSWPTYLYDEETDEELEVNVPDELVEHLADGYVAVLMEAGAEKRRYVNGYAVAIHSSGEVVSLSLDDIYQKAKEAFGPVAVITQAAY